MAVMSTTSTIGCTASRITSLRHNTGQTNLSHQYRSDTRSARPRRRGRPRAARGGSAGTGTPSPSPSPLPIPCGMILFRALRLGDSPGLGEGVVFLAAVTVPQKSDTERIGEGEFGGEQAPSHCYQRLIKQDVPTESILPLYEAYLRRPRTLILCSVGGF